MKYPIAIVATLFFCLPVAGADPSKAPPRPPSSGVIGVTKATYHPQNETVRPPIVASGLPVPRWVTVKADRVNVRRGPSTEHDVLWTYVKPGTPVEVIAEYDSWRRIRDQDGETGWVKSAMLDGRRNVVVTGRVNAPLLERPLPGAATVALAAPGVLAELRSCAGRWCEVSARGYDGFITRDRLWGVYPAEIIQ